MRAKLLGILVCGLGLGLTACGDDDGGGDPTDGGAEEDTGPGATDAGRDTGTVPMDAGMDASTALPIELCDPFTTGECAEDEKCAVVLDATDPDNGEILYGCVPKTTGTKAEGVVCARGLSQDATPDDEDDAFLTHECAEGLFCWTTSGASLARCHRLCGDERVDCQADAYCQGLNSEPFFGICDQAEGCDPVFQTGCSGDRHCYLIANTQGDYLGACFPFAPADGGTGEPGEACTFINNCQPGVQCFPEFFPDGGTSETRNCKSLCNAGPPADGGAGTDGGAMDGGTPMDAGPTFTGDCTGALTCVAIPLGDGGVAMVPTDPGVCQ